MVKLPCVLPQSCPRNFARDRTQRRAAQPHGIKVPDALANQLRFRGRDGRLKVAALYTFHAQRRSREIGGPDAGWLPLWGTCRNPHETPGKTPSHESAAHSPRAPTAKQASQASAPPSAPSSHTRLLHLPPQSKAPATPQPSASLPPGSGERR